MIALACDNAGLLLKKEVMTLLDSRGISYKDFGTNNEESCDYPIYAYKAAQAILKGECDKGIIFCGTGVGISIAANKVKGIRCVVCSDCYSAKLAKEHNNANMLALGGRVIGFELAKMIVTSWLDAEFQGGRHQRRLDIITSIEDGSYKELE